MRDDTTDHSVILVTGPSGAGRSTAIRALEDLGFEGIDNIPLSLVPRLVEGPPLGRPIVLGLDVRNRDFNTTALIELVDGLTRDPRVDLEVLYLDCGDTELIRRFSETRRRHPLAPSETPAEGIQRERDLLAPILVRADHLLDTSELSPHDLKAELGRLFATDGAGRLSVSVQSFSYKRGVPRGVDMIFDCRFLANPHWQAELRAMNGLDAPVVDYVARDPRFGEFIRRVMALLEFQLPESQSEGKSYLSIGFGCTGGQHRSVAIAEIIGAALAQQGWQVSKRHRELERKGQAAAAPPAGRVSVA